MANLNWRNGVFGVVFRPSQTTDEGNDEVMHSSDYSVSENFMSEYNNHIAAMQIVAECAKVYILKNWEKVKDWSNLNVVIQDNSGKPTDYYNYKKEEFKKENPAQEKFLEEIFEDMELRDAKRHNSIKSVENVVLDTSDGDFSITINGKKHLWISDDSIIVIANYIEEMNNF